MTHMTAYNLIQDIDLLLDQMPHGKEKAWLEAERRIEIFLRENPPPQNNYCNKHGQHFSLDATNNKYDCPQCSLESSTPAPVPQQPIETLVSNGIVSVKAGYQIGCQTPAQAIPPSDWPKHKPYFSKDHSSVAVFTPWNNKWETYTIVPQVTQQPQTECNHIGFMQHDEEVKGAMYCKNCCKWIKPTFQPQTGQVSKLKISYAEFFKAIRELMPVAADCKCVCEHLLKDPCELNCPEHSKNAIEKTLYETGEGGEREESRPIEELADKYANDEHPDNDVHYNISERSFLAGYEVALSHLSQLQQTIRTQQENIERWQEEVSVYAKRLRVLNEEVEMLRKLK